MDQIDRAILHHLQRDGRLPNNELAARVGLSPSPCLRRVKQLEQTGVIVGYMAVVDPARVDRDYEVLVWVTLSAVTRDSMAAFETALDDVEDVVEAHRMMGQPDYLLRVVTANRETYETLYIEALAALPHVQTLTSQLAMKTVKRQRALPVRSHF